MVKEFAAIDTNRYSRRQRVKGAQNAAVCGSVEIEKQDIRRDCEGDGAAMGPLMSYN